MAIGAAGAIIALAASAYIGYLVGSRPVGTVVRGYEYRLDSIQSAHKYVLDSLTYEITEAESSIAVNDSILAVPQPIRHESNLRITRSIARSAQLDSLLPER